MIIFRDDDDDDDNVNANDNDDDEKITFIFSTLMGNGSRTITGNGKMKNGNITENWK